MVLQSASASLTPFASEIILVSPYPENLPGDIAHCFLLLSNTAAFSCHRPCTHSVTLGMQAVIATPTWRTPEDQWGWGKLNEKNPNTWFLVRTKDNRNKGISLPLRGFLGYFVTSMKSFLISRCSLSLVPSCKRFQSHLHSHWCEWHCYRVCWI